MRPEALYLEDVLDAADAIADFLEGVDRGRFEGDDLVRSAVLHKLAVIGEAAANVSAERRAAWAEIPWVQIVGFRNFVVHEYFGLDPEITWNTATVDLPELRAQVAVRLEEVRGEGG